jgi:hypothetical protein
LGYFYFPHCYVASIGWPILHKHGTKFVVGFLLCSLNPTPLLATPFHYCHFLLPFCSLYVGHLIFLLSCCLFLFAHALKLTHNHNNFANHNKGIWNFVLLMDLYIDIPIFWTIKPRWAQEIFCTLQPFTANKSIQLLGQKTIIYVSCSSTF